MAQVLIRGLDHRTVARLKSRARRNSRSLEAEVRSILEEAAQTLDYRAALERIRSMFAGGTPSDSAPLTGEDRHR